MASATESPKLKTSEAEGDDGGAQLNFPIMYKLLPEPPALSEPGS